MRTMFIILAAILMMPGCSSRPIDRAKARPKCPVLPEQDIDDVTFVQFKGMRVGLCCSECVDRWDRMTDEMKREALERVRRPDQGL